jgi:hypothetical protein
MNKKKIRFDQLISIYLAQLPMKENMCSILSAMRVKLSEFKFKFKLGEFNQEPGQKPAFAGFRYPSPFLLDFSLKIFGLL